MLMLVYVFLRQIIQLTFWFLWPCYLFYFNSSLLASLEKNILRYPWVPKLAALLLFLEMFAIILFLDILLKQYCLMSVKPWGAVIYQDFKLLQHYQDFLIVCDFTMFRSINFLITSTFLWFHNVQKHYLTN